MRVVVTAERRFDRTPDGHIWTAATVSYPFLQKYLEVFDHVCVMGRVRDVSDVDPTWKRADGPNVSFAAVPYFVGPGQYLLRRRRAVRAIRKAVEPGDAIILRAPGTIGTLLEPYLWRRRRPFAVEVVADPYDVFAPGSVRHPLRPLLRWWFFRVLQRQCARAGAAAYVTAGYLQQRYPPAADAYAIGCSDIDLLSAAYVTGARRAQNDRRQLRILLVGSLEQLYKSPDVLIKAVAAVARRGLDLELTIVGDGKHRRELEALAKTFGVRNRVRFTGNLAPGDPVRAELDRADLFVLPSRTEGLPRALIEAMARGLPCLGTSIGGIPELLSREELVPVGDVTGLATKIEEILTDRHRLERLSARNLEKAQEFRAEILKPRRRAFLEAVHDLTLKWQRGRGT